MPDFIYTELLEVVKPFMTFRKLDESGELEAYVNPDEILRIAEEGLEKRKHSWDANFLKEVENCRAFLRRTEHERGPENDSAMGYPD